MIDVDFVVLFHGQITNSNNLIVIESENESDPTTTIDLEKLGIIIDNETQGITMNCGGKDIKYQYENFNVKFVSGCNDDTSYLVFTLIDGEKGAQTLGGYGNNSSGSTIADLEIQNGVFYVKNKCNSINGVDTSISSVLIG